MREQDAIILPRSSALTDAQLATAQDIFDEFRNKELKPACIADPGPQPRPPRQARHLRPARLPPGHLRGRPPPLRQMVRRAVRLRGKHKPKGAVLVI